MAKAKKTFKRSENPTLQAEPVYKASAETLAEISSIDGSYWKLCLHPLEFKRDRNPSLASLIAQSGSSNPFFDPAFLMASRDRMVKSQIHQLVVWEGLAEKQTPKLSIPLVYVGSSLLVPGHWKAVTHPFAPLGDPLVNKAEEQEVLIRFKSLLASALDNDFPPIVLDNISQRSPFFDICKDEAFSNSLSCLEHVLGERASINQLDENNTFSFSRKRRREFDRLLKKLNEVGETSFEKASDPFDVLLRFEEFLLLETRGWKGRNGTSIHAIKRDAAFARQSVNDLARDGRCEIFTLRLDDKPIASIILFKLNGGYFPWKITFDSIYSKYSPGSQLMVRLSQDICAKPDFEYADSLAMYGQSWMTMLWPDTLSFKRLILAKDNQTSEAIERSFEVKSGLKNFIRKFFPRPGRTHPSNSHLK